MAPVVIGVVDVWDIIVIILYFLAVFAVGIWSSMRNRGSVGGYFLAGRSMGWFPVGASLFASNIGSTSFIGFAGNAALTGVAMNAFEYMTTFNLSLLAWLALPVYIASGALTMPEYLKKRFGGKRIRIYIAAISLLLYITTRISNDLYAGAIFIQQAMNITIYPSTIILLIISALFTITGGLTAVIWTDSAQAIIILLGAVFLCIRSFQVINGFDNMVVNYFNAIPNTTRAYRSTSFNHEGNTFDDLQPDLYGSDADRARVWDNRNPPNQPEGIYAECSIPSHEAMQMLRSISSTDLPWIGSLFGILINASWYWCFDQVLVQRCMAAKNITHAKAGIVLCIFLKLTPLWLMFMPGMAARVLFADSVACGDANVCRAVCDKAAGCTDVAYPSLVLNLLPSGARGLMLATMMASLVSGLTSTFNSTSTIFSLDIWRYIRPSARDSELMIVGRTAVVVLVAISIAWMPIVQSSEALMSYVQAVVGYLSPPICAIYLFALFWPRANEIGVFSGLMVGLVIGLARFIWEMTYPTVPCGEVNNNPPHFLVAIHYLHFSILLFGFTAVAVIVASLVTPPLPRSFTRRLIFQDRHAAFDPELDALKLTIVSEEEKEEWIAEGEAAKPVLSGWKKVVNWFCGIESMLDEREPVFTEEEAEELIEAKKHEMSIEEDHKWKLVVNVCGACSVIATIFFWAFFE
ncbi:hypothetical protein Aperf_G00000060235 [Anoplocephala perfoliata]